jgi:hypothetical protein
MSTANAAVCGVAGDNAVPVPAASMPHQEKGTRKRPSGIVKHPSKKK